MKVLTTNRKAHFNYFIEDRFEAGIELQGWEVKSARASNINLADSFVFFDKTEQCYLKNCHFAPYEYGDTRTQEPTRDRKLLLNKSQIVKLHSAVKTKGLTIIPTKIYLNSRGLVKVEVALARGKHTYDKKQSLKEKDIARSVERETANYARAR